MDQELTLTGLADRLGNLGITGRVLVENAIARGLKAAEIIAVAGVKQGFAKGVGPDGVAWQPLRRPRPGSKGADKPLRDTGQLMASIQAKAAGNTIEVGTNREQAALQNFGGTVTPKNAKYLAIPATREAQRAGSPRRFPRKLKVLLGRKGGIMYETRKVRRKLIGEVEVPEYYSHVLGRVVTKREKVYTKSTGKTERVVQYYLTKRVDIPGRLFVGFSLETTNKIGRLIMGEIEAAFFPEK